MHCAIDAPGTIKAGSRMIKLLGWYENLGHAARLLDVARLYAEMEAAGACESHQRIRTYWPSCRPHLESRPDIDVVAINDLFDPNALRYLRTTTLSWVPLGNRRSRGRRLMHANARAKLLANPPLSLPWAELAIDVVEATEFSGTRTA